MIVRSASFKDYEAIESLYHEAVLSSQMSAYVGGDRPVPQRALLKIWFALSKSISAFLPLTEEGDALFVAVSGGGDIVGFLQAQAQAKPVKLWHIVNMCLADGTGDDVAHELIGALCAAAIPHRIERITVRMPAEHPLLGPFTTQAFRSVLTEQILFFDLPGDQPAGEHPGVRPYEKDDRDQVHFLYMTSTPASIASLEAPSYQAWIDSFAQGMFKGGTKDDVLRFVAVDGGIVGFAGAFPGRDARPAQIYLLGSPAYGDAMDRLVDALLGSLPAGPVSCVLRHFDEVQRTSLRARGFEVYGTQILLVRDVRAKLPVAKRASARAPMLAHAVAGRVAQMTSASPFPLSLSRQQTAAYQTEDGGER